MAKFSPDQLSNLKTWISADSINLPNNSSISTWIDKSGNNLSFIQTTASRQPILINNALNGYPVVRFQASATQSMTLTYTFSNPCTVFYVSKQGITKARMLSGLSNNWLLGYWGGAKNQYYCEGWNSASGTPTSDTNPYIWCGITQGGSLVSKAYNNGTLFVSSTGGVTAPNGLSLNGHLSSSEFSDGDMAEVIVYNSALSDLDRQKVETYLAYKYNIPISTYAYPKQIGEFETVDIYSSNLWYELTQPVVFTGKFKHYLNKNIKYMAKINNDIISSSDFVSQSTYIMNFQVDYTKLNIGSNTLTIYIVDVDGSDSTFTFNVIKEDRDTNSMNRSTLYASEWNLDNSNIRFDVDNGITLKEYGENIATTNNYSHINTKGKAKIVNITIDGKDDITETPNYIRDMINYQSVDTGIIWVQDLGINKYKNVNSIIALRK